MLVVGRGRRLWAEGLLVTSHEKGLDCIILIQLCVLYRGEKNTGQVDYFWKRIIYFKDIGVGRKKQRL